MSRSKSVTSRQFQHGFSQLATRLKPGDSITVTKHGKPLGTFTRAGRTRSAPDYLRNLEKLGYSKELGQKVIDAICDLP